MGKRWVEGMRDAFFDSLFECARSDRRVVLVASDTGAICLDRFRKELPCQFVNIGIAEQNMVGVAAGMAMSGKKAFVYAIAPFATMRCYEQIRIDLCCMNLPVTVVGIGAGLDYSTLGPTHHSTEDISLMCSLPHMVVYSPSDGIAASSVVSTCYSARTPCYVRLDRCGTPLVYRNKKDIDYKAGFSIIKKPGNVSIVSTGRMTYTALCAARKLSAIGIEASVIDVYRLKPFPEEMWRAVLKDAEYIVTLEEHFLRGGLGDIITLLHSRMRGSSGILTLGIPLNFCRQYGSREFLRSIYGLDTKSVVKRISAWVKHGRGEYI